MKKALIVFVLVFAVVLMGCPSLNIPLHLGDGTVGARTGQSSGTIILGFIGNVDAGMITAARNGSISTIGAVDFEVKSMLGTLMLTFTTTVSGN